MAHRWPRLLGDTEVVEKIKLPQLGRLVKLDGARCSVAHAPTAQQIGSARRAYLNRWGALLVLSADLSRCGMVGDVEIMDAMPLLTSKLRVAGDEELTHRRDVASRAAPEEHPV